MKNVLITGISKGIGKALAQKFLKENYFVFGTSITGQVDFVHENLSLLPLELTSEESILNCIKNISDSGKKIDILINNAGALLDEEETVVVPEKLRQTLEINLIGPISLTEKILPSINNGGHIVNISSSAGSLQLVGHESHFEGHYPAYKISKSGLNMYTRTLALRLKDNVTVSSVHPGWVKTDMGGYEAQITAEEAAENIFNFAITNPQTGQFWFNGEMMPW
jgi:NAD(P)-dependent dehydrogenase (short-subunit alcohol dehydrogenase family)